MAHFAEIDENNKVLRVIVVNNSDILDEEGSESELKGIEFCKNIFGGEWRQTSYSSSFRGHFAAAGFTYDPIADIFIPNTIESGIDKNV